MLAGIPCFGMPAVQIYIGFGIGLAYLLIAGRKTKTFHRDIYYLLIHLCFPYVH